MNSRTSRLVVAGLALVVFASSARGQSQSPPTADPAEQRYLEAREHWSNNRLAEAIAGFEALLSDHRDRRFAVHAAELLLDSLNRAKDYGRMAEWVDRLLADPALLSRAPDLAERLRALRGQLGRKRAEEQERRGEFDACARTYLALHAQAPTSQTADELLYNAGVCHEADGARAKALVVFSQLVAKHPRSRLASRAMARLASGYRSLARFEEAASFYERYARTYGGEREAPEALLEAVTLRMAMGEDAAARKLAELFAKLYARRHAREAVRVAYAVIRGEETHPREVIPRLQQFLKRWGGAAPKELMMIAYARMGALLWDQSCKGGSGRFGACTRVVRLAAANRCEPGQEPRVLARNARLAKSGRAALEQALAIQVALARSSAPSAQPELGAAVDEARAKAMFYLAQADFETYLGLVFPTGLTFDPNKPKAKAESTRRFREWLDEKQALFAKLSGSGAGSSTSGSYRAIVDLGARGGQWTTAAALRMAELALGFEHAMRTAEIPVDVRTGAYAEDKTRAFCHELQLQSRPIGEVGKQALLFCVERGSASPHAHAWTTKCRQELEARWPVEFPGQPEIHQRAFAGDPVTDLAPLLARESQVPTRGQSSP